MYCLRGPKPGVRMNVGYPMNSKKLWTRWFCFLLSLLVCSGATTAYAENPAVSDAARTHFKAGLAYLEDPGGAKYEEAYREFHTAYADSPSYKILNNIGLCALYLERDGEAIDSYEGYLAAAPKAEIPDKQRLQIESDLARLKSGIVTLTLKGLPPNTNIVDERLVTQGSNLVNRYTANTPEFTLRIHPGNHRVTLQAKGYQSEVFELNGNPSTQHTHDAALVKSESSDTSAKPVTAVNQAPTTEPPAASAKSSLGPAFYVSAIATGVFAASATATGLLALSSKKELKQLNEEKSDLAGAKKAHDDTNRYALFCDLSIGATILAAGATTYFYLSAPTTEKPPAANARINLTPVLGQHETGLAITGTF